MAAANTDKFRKQTSNFSTTLGAGISDSDTTISLSSTTGLPTDTAVTLTIDRVDSNGVSTPAKVERITGVVSGTDIVTSLRGEDGTTPAAHDAGAVVEVIWDAETWNDTIDGVLVEHDQDGTHDTTKVVDLTTAQTLTNKTIGTTNLISFNSPEGYLINGKIVPSVTSDNLTVALKGLDGNDPSATNPIYVRIGDTVHSITSALSVTTNAGTNLFNAGSDELATKEIDYFTYLGYNATDGVVLGFSRIPYATDYSQFSATTTNEKYCAISTITNAASGDDYTVIGRFAATLSAGAGYTWSVPTFTSINLIQRPIFETRNLTWQPTYSAGGSMTYTSVTTGMTSYKIVGDNIFIRAMVTGTTGGTASNNVRITSPFSNGVNSRYCSFSCWFLDGGSSYMIARNDIGINGSNIIPFYRYDNANFGLGTGRQFNANGSYSIA